MIRLIQVEEIEQLLQQLPRIVELRKSQPVAYVARAAMWMDLLEQALLAAHADQVGQIALLHSSLIYARHTAARDAAEPHAQLTRARRLALEASAALEQAAGIATAILDEHRPRLAEAQRLLRDLLARARSLNLMPAAGAQPTHARLTEVRLALATNRKLERAYAAVEAQVGADDALLLLGRALGAGLVPPGPVPPTVGQPPTDGPPPDSAGVAHRR